MNDTLARFISPLFSWSDGDQGMRRLASLLDVSIDDLRASRTDPRFAYRPFTIRKRGGGRRQIAAPSSPLKRMQRRLLRQYLAEEPVHQAAKAFRRGGSIADHARSHLGQALVLTVDLADFFPSTAARRVHHWFRDRGWDGETLEILMRLSVYRGGLPQGAPTSPALSNLVNRPLDERLSELAGHHGARYSRYSDDLAFSWGIPVEPPLFRCQVESILASYAYRIQPEKDWRLQQGNQRPEITGVVLAGHRLRLPERIRRRIRSLRSRWFGTSESDRQKLAGYAGFRKMLR